MKKGENILLIEAENSEMESYLKVIVEYLKGNFVSSKVLMSKIDNMENELILGFRK